MPMPPSPTTSMVLPRSPVSGAEFPISDRFQIPSVWAATARLMPRARARVSAMTCSPIMDEAMRWPLVSRHEPSLSRGMARYRSTPAAPTWAQRSFLPAARSSVVAVPMTCVGVADQFQGVIVRSEGNDLDAGRNSRQHRQPFRPVVPPQNLAWFRPPLVVARRRRAFPELAFFDQFPGWDETAHFIEHRLVCVAGGFRALSRHAANHGAEYLLAESAAFRPARRSAST